MPFCKSSLTLFLSGILLTSCLQRKNSFTETMQLEAGKEFILHLDSVTAPSGVCLQYVNGTDSMPGNFLAQYNPENRDINIYDFSQGTLLKKIAFPLEGPSSLPKVDGFHFISPDSLILYNYPTKSFTITDLKKNTRLRLYPLNSFKTYFADSSAILPADPVVSTNQPVCYLNQQLYTSGHILYIGPGMDKKTLSSVCRIDLKDSMATNLCVSEKYFKHKMWCGEHYNIFQTINKEKQTLVFSLPMSDSLFTLDIKTGKISSHYAGSRHFTETDILPFRNDLTGNNIPGQLADLQFFFDHPSYCMVTYDPYRKVYYRMAIKPSGATSRAGLQLATSIVIILNEKFEKTGEIVLPDTYYAFSGHFITPEGLYLRKKETENEDIMRFTCFTLKKK